ncbi:hypothetical protein [Ilumatobacter nonamiensis]|uniref:hypothetical protein n=1 Tax=Ilumatobacter nonamiensis TaxID=467093 RepID=UPI00034D2BC5|nr:hypothetical protein [Ilumatobacter nonamiensis]
MPRGFDFIIDSEILDTAVFAERWASAVRADMDVSTLTTWDPALNRNRRILVPIDVQAYVAHPSVAEPVVAVTGGFDDPPPFATGDPLPAGVHLHWATPDALLRGAESDAGGELELPELPERWVVVRALFPNGFDRPMLRGWVIDARKGTVTDLDGFTGDTPDGTAEFDRVDGTVGGSPLWTASYHASAGRFGFHDPLDDIDQLTETASDGFFADVATYVVAGWSPDQERDPLFAVGSGALTQKVNDYGWYLDPEGDPVAYDPDEPALDRLSDTGVLQRPAEEPVTEVMVKGADTTFTYADVAPQLASPVERFSRLVLSPRPPRFLSLLHGMVTGVPVDAPPAGVDERPGESALSLAIGLDTDDVVAALGADTLGTSPEARRGAELLAAAFSSDLIDRLGEPDGPRDIAEREHADTFWSLAGPPLPNARPDQLRVEDTASTNPTTVGRKGRANAGSARTPDKLDPQVGWRDAVVFSERNAPGPAGAIVDPKAALAGVDGRVSANALGSRRTVERPAPRIFRPQAPVVAIKGARPSLRHHHDGLHDADGLLRCRFPNEIVQEIKNVVHGADLVPTLGSGALPFEVLQVVREAMLLNPYVTRWVAEAAAPDPAIVGQFQTRVQAEMLRLYAPDGRYDGTGVGTLSTAPATTRGRRPQAVAGDAWDSVSTYDTIVGHQAAAEVAKLSAIVGTTPSPLGVTAWRQPWVPLWLEWRVELVGSTGLAGWELGDLDLRRTDDPFVDPVAREFVGRSPVGRGLSNALHAGIERWLAAEEQREATEQVLDADEQAVLERLDDFLRPLDLASASLDGIREQLLGIDFVGNLTSGVDEDDRPVASRDPITMFGGTIRLLQLRLVDAFGRTLEVPLGDAQTTSELEVDGTPAAIRVAPRMQHGARWLFRLVDPAYTGDPLAAPEAFVNQLEPNLAVNPVAGYFMADHIDEAFEAFDVEGTALGQLSHHEITGAVRWDPAPGRPVPPGAGPLAELGPGALTIGQIAAGVVRADVAHRASGTAGVDSSLTALLRAIDTTLWTVDTYAALGSSSVASLVGRPIAVVKATLRLDIPDDVGEVIVTAPGGEPARMTAFEALTDQRFPVRFGDLQRSDDSLLGFYVDDDYDRFHLVDKALAADANDVGRHRGQLGLLGTVDAPDLAPLDHPLLVAEDTLFLRPGQAVRLTLLMLPAGRVHVTSGILPRKALALADAWTGRGLARLMPSVRVGPVLVDPAEIRLPKVDLLGENQQFTRRTGPLTWRDDPIVSATQAALLPRTPHEIQEGWVRVMDQSDGGDGR